VSQREHADLTSLGKMVFVLGNCGAGYDVPIEQAFDPLLLVIALFCRDFKRRRGKPISGAFSPNPLAPFPADLQENKSVLKRFWPAFLHDGAHSFCVGCQRNYICVRGVILVFRPRIRSFLCNRPSFAPGVFRNFFSALF
jgi:hypothetical protein